MGRIIPHIMENKDMVQPSEMAVSSRIEIYFQIQQYLNWENTYDPTMVEQYGDQIDIYFQIYFQIHHLFYGHKWWIPTPPFEGFSNQHQHIHRPCHGDFWWDIVLDNSPLIILVTPKILCVGLWIESFHHQKPSFDFH